MEHELVGGESWHAPIHDDQNKRLVVKMKARACLWPTYSITRKVKHLLGCISDGCFSETMYIYKGGTHDENDGVGKVSLRFFCRHMSYRSEIALSPLSKKSARELVRARVIYYYPCDTVVVPWDGCLCSLTQHFLRPDDLMSTSTSAVGRYFLRYTPLPKIHDNFDDSRGAEKENSRSCQGVRLSQ